MNLENLTTPEIIANGVVYTVEGIIVVFSVLILIMLVIYAMSLFSGDKKKKKAKAPAIEQAVPIVEDTIEETIDEGELIAVLTAAVAACMGQSAASVNIRSYKKVSSAWGNSAKREALNNRI